MSVMKCWEFALKGNMTATTQLPSVISEHNSALEGHPFFGPSRMRHSKSEAFESIILDNVSTAHLLQTTETTKFGIPIPSYLSVRGHVCGSSAQGLTKPKKFVSEKNQNPNE